MAETPAPRRIRKILIRSAVVLGLGLVLVVSVASSRKSASRLPLGFAETPRDATPQRQSAPAARIETAKVEAAEESDAVRLTGTLEADERAQVASRASGIVEKVFVDLGSIVKKGDPLVRLDPVDAQNALAEGEAVAKELRARLALRDLNQAFNPASQPDARAAKATLDLAEANFRRTRQLQKDGVISQAEFDQKKLDNDSARDRYDLALTQARQLYQSYLTAQTRLVALRRAVEKTLIVAPFAGMIAEKKVSPGERVEPMAGGGVVVTLVKMDPLRLCLTVPQQYSGAVKEGQMVAFELEGSPGRTFTGKVACIGAALDTASRSLKAEALVDNPSHELRPGLFATAKLELPTRTTVLSVPASAVIRANDAARVFVLREGATQAQLVATGETKNGRTEITAGLSKGDVVVLNPAQAQDGVKVQ